MSDEPPPVTPISPPITRKRVQSDPKYGLQSYEEVSEGSDDEQLPRRYEPSPRRLRPRAERSQDSNPIARHLPVRAGKPKIGDLQEDETDLETFGSDNEGVPASSAVDTDRDEDEESDYDEDDVSPRKLRSGKVIMPEQQQQGEDEDSEEDEEGEDDDAEADEDYMEEDEEARVSSEREGSVDDEVDLSEETVKTLTRYRREELVRLCESRNLGTEGTKPQLAKALLQWVRVIHRLNNLASC